MAICRSKAPDLALDLGFDRLFTESLQILRSRLAYDGSMDIDPILSTSPHLGLTM